MNNFFKFSWFTPQGGFSVETETWLTRLDAQGYTRPSAATISAIDTFNLAISGFRSSIDILYIMAFNNASLTDTFKVNLITPSANEITIPAGGVTTLVSGQQGNNVDGYLSTNFNPSTAGGDYTLNSACRFMWVYQQDSAAPAHIDGTTNSGFNILSALNNTTHRINAGAGGALNSAVSMSGTGYRAINRSDSTNVQLYNGLTKSDRTQTSVALFNSNQFIFRNGVDFSNPIISMYGMGASLSEANHNILNNAFSAYLTAVGL